MNNYVGLAFTIIYFGIGAFKYISGQRPEERIYRWLLVPTTILFLAIFALLREQNPMVNWFCGLLFVEWLVETLLLVRGTLAELKTPKKIYAVRPRSDRLLFAAFWLLVLLAEVYWIYKYVP